MRHLRHSKPVAFAGVLFGSFLGMGSPASAQLVDLDATVAGLLGQLSGAADIDALQDVTVDLLSPDGPLIDLSNGLNLLDADVSRLELAAATADIDIADLRTGLSALRSDVNVELGDLRTSIGDMRTSFEGDIAALEAADVDIRQAIGAQGVRLTAVEDGAARTGVAIADLGRRQDATAALVGAQASTVSQQGRAIDGLASALAASQEQTDRRFAAVDRKLDVANEGVAMAFALKAPYVAPDKSFALSGGWGGFEGENAFAVSGAVRTGEYIQLDAGIAVGAAEGSIGGRAGATISW